tara:strand:+ start:106 stop:375 length:270 start_codon:yes stop_codon:yes gene_type:complete
MKIIISANITEGYSKWRDAFVSADALREKYDMKVLAWGHPKGDENKVYQVVEVESMEKMQEAIKDPDIENLRLNAGVDFETQEVIVLEE